MKKGILIGLLLLVCFWHININADDNLAAVSGLENPVVEAIGDELDPEAEEIAHDKGKDKHRVCIQFIDTTPNPSNNVSSSACGTASGSKFSKALKSTSFSYGNKLYEFDGWYDEAGNKVTTYYNGDETRIKVSYTYDSSKCQVIRYYLRWSETTLPIFHFVVTDMVSDGDVNTTYYYAPKEGGTYTHHFYKAPSTKAHYNFLYWKVEDETEIYKVGDDFNHDVANQGMNTEVTITGDAYWQADVTLNLYDGTKLLSSESDFSSVSVNTPPEKFGYNFLGWVDENGNEVTEKTFYPEQAGTNPTPVVINLYAKWEQIKTDIDVTKVWEDENNLEGFRPSNITIELLADGSKVDEVTLSGTGNKWTYTFKNLVKYGTEKEIDYSVQEVKVDNYKTTIDGFTITNYREVEKIDLTVKKIWNDNNNQDGIRPKELIVSLNTGDKVTLNEANSWKFTIQNLIKNADGKEIKYTWAEESVDGYELTDTTVDETTTTFTNTHTPKVTNIKVTKVWSDDNNESGKRPESVTINIFANGTKCGEVILSSDNEWKYEFTSLPVNDNGKEIDYTIREDNVPNGYEVSYEETNDGFIIHNVLGQGDGEIESTPSNNPQTGDDIFLYVFTLLISLMGIIVGKLYVKSFN